MNPKGFLATKWRTLNIRTRLSAGYAATLAGLLAVYAGAVFLIVSERFGAEVDRRLDQEVEIAERSLFVARSGSLEWRSPAASADDHEPMANMLWVDVHRADGRLLHLQLGGFARGNPVEPLTFAPDRSGFFSVAQPNGTRLRILQRHIVVDGGPKAVIRAALAEDQIRREMAIILLVLGGGLPFSVATAGLAGYWLARRALAPIDRITEEARAITADRLDARLPVLNAQDELGRLATTFNDMFSRLESSFEQLRRFTADASHELRTPLTVIRSVGEVGLREPHDAAGYREIIGTMLEEADRLALLTSTLLELTRAEGGRGRIEREPIDLCAFAVDAAEFLGVLAEEKGVVIALDLPAAPPTVLGDRTVLRQALANVLDNAVKHSPAGATVTVAVQAGGERAEISVADQGPGIAPEHRERVFDRFYRADPSRNSRTGGFGLGLAIARWAVEANGGCIEVESAPGKGSVFRMVLPGGGAT